MHKIDCNLFVAFELIVVSRQDESYISMYSIRKITETTSDVIKTHRTRDGKNTSSNLSYLSTIHRRSFE